MTIDQKHLDDEKLIAFANNELTEAESAEFAEHVSACVQCGGAVFQFRTIKSLLRGDFVREPPPEVLARAQNILRQFEPTAAPHAISWWSRITRADVFQLSRPFAMAGAFALVLVTLLLFLGGVRGLALTTQQAIPGDQLYPVKLEVEALQLAFTADDAARVQLHRVFADRRTNEIAALTAKGRFDQVATATQALENELDQTIAALTTLAQSNPARAKELEPSVAATVSQNQQVLATLLSQVPEQAKPAIERAIQASDHDTSTLKEKLEPALSITPTRTFTAAPVQTPTVTRTPVPSKEPPGQVKTPGQEKQPPDNTKTPGPPAVPPGQQKTNSETPILTPTPSATPRPSFTPRSNRTAAPSNVPPGQQKTPENKKP